MKNFSDLTAVQLATDDDFIRWVKAGSKGDEFDIWILQNPDKIEVVNEAISIIRAVENDKEYILTGSKNKELWSRIASSVEESKKKDKFSGFKWYSIAAIIILLITAGFAVFQVALNNYGFGNDDFLKYTNESNKPYTLVLEDGSSVILKPHSVLQYPEAFHSKREVYLSGEGFFQVKRNPEKPFSVYTSDIVTTVLGTSFDISAYKSDPEITVAVKTGKVSVSTTTERMKDETDSTKNLAGILITRNQQISYSRKDGKMVKGLVSEPSTYTNANFVFKDMPVRDIFTSLEEAYGIDIIFDDEIMENCRLTANLNNTPFFDKLRLICKGINAKYDILDAHIIVTGNGCD